MLVFYLLLVLSRGQLFDSLKFGANHAKCGFTNASTNNNRPDPVPNGPAFKSLMESNRLTSEHYELLERCQDRIGYQFTDSDLLFEAITHASGARTRLTSNERLEFLGDSILGFIVCEKLFRDHPEWLEGELTKIKSIVVSRQSCADIAEEMGYGEFLIVGRGVTASGDVPPSLLANAFESIIAAIYIDSDLETVRNFLLPMIEPLIRSAIEGESQVNYKSAFQQFSQKEYGVSPNYKLVDSKGPDHNKSFLVAAYIGKRGFDPAWGKNKKEAEQGAAANALQEIESDE